MRRAYFLNMIYSELVSDRAWGNLDNKCKEMVPFRILLELLGCQTWNAAKEAL